MSTNFFKQADKRNIAVCFSCRKRGFISPFFIFPSFIIFVLKTSQFGKPNLTLFTPPTPTFFKSLLWWLSYQFISAERIIDWEDLLPGSNTGVPVRHTIYTRATTDR